jgi:RNA polymerase sigma-70 factor (ECF subfamily)
VLLALHDIEGYSLADLQEITGLKEGTLKSRLHRARVRLGKLLQREQRFGPSSRTAEMSR